MALGPSRLSLGSVWVLLGYVVAMASSPSAWAQSVPLPVFPAVDERGVDVATGGFTLSQTDVAIGPPDGGLTYTRHYRSSAAASLVWTSNHNSFVYADGTTCSVVLGTRTETFTSSASDCLGTFTSQQQVGSTFTYSTSSQIYTYTLRDGTVVTFKRIDRPDFIVTMTAYEVVGYITSMTDPASDKTTYEYEWGTTCWPDPYWCLEQWDTGRLRTIYNNLGYRLWLHYPNPYPPSLVQTDMVTGVNNAVEYCVPYIPHISERIFA